MKVADVFMKSHSVEKQWRLYALECARRVEYILGDPESTTGAEVLDVTEQHISGKATDEELYEAHAKAEKSVLGISRYIEDEILRESDNRIAKTVAEKHEELGNDRAKAYAIASTDAEMAELSSILSAMYTISLAARFSPDDAEKFAKEVENAAAQVFADRVVQEVAWRTAYMAELENPPMYSTRSGNLFFQMVNKSIWDSGIKDSDGLAPLNPEEWRRTLDAIHSQAVDFELSLMRKEMNRPESAEDPTATAGFVAHLDEEHGNVSSANGIEMTDNIG